jgi:hypothetical protein
VNVQGANIQGVQRGGKSDKATGTQNRAISQLVRDMEMTPEAFVDFLKANGRELKIPDEGDPGPAINAFLVAQSADQAGALITLLANEKDRRLADDDDIPEEPDGGYPG